MVQTLTDSFKKDGLNGMVAELGNILADILTNLEVRPKFIDLGVEVLENLLKGLQKNSNKIGQAGVKIIKSFSGVEDTSRSRRIRSRCNNFIN